MYTTKDPFTFFSCRSSLLTISTAKPFPTAKDSKTHNAISTSSSKRPFTMNTMPHFNNMDLTPIPIDYNKFQQIEVSRMSAPLSPRVPQFPITLNFYKNKKVRQYSTSEPLPIDFTPCAYSVICGRGKVCTDAIGNRRLKVIASMFLEKYSHASTKEQKSMIVTEIMDMLEDACPDGRGTFVRFEKGRWWVIDHMAAREKVGALLRDCLHTKYRSSTKAKLARRRRSSLLQDNSEGFSTSSSSDCESSSEIRF